MRPAFTIIELLVAITVLTVGVLALAATAGLVASQVGEGGQLTRSAHIARSLLDSLGALECAGLTSDSTSRDGAAAQWVVSRDSASAHAELTVGAALRRRTRRDVYRVSIPCARE
jgi:Tfp pilus assembly protein PilV